MGGNRRSNKARNQTRGRVRHQDDAPWHAKNRKRNKKRRQIAKASRRKNRGR